MNIASFSGRGSTPIRRRFWDSVTKYVKGSQKIAGRNVTLDVHEGKGTVINSPDRKRGGATPINPCLTPDAPTISIVFSGVEPCFDCVLPSGGPYTLTNVGSGSWFGTAGEFACFGGDPQPTSITVVCTGEDTWAVGYQNDNISPFTVFQGNGSNPIANELATCDDGGLGSGGTASVFA